MISDYFSGFIGHSALPDEVFLTYFESTSSKSIITHEYTRSRFWDLCKRGVNALKSLGMKSKCTQIHYFSANRVFDLVCRNAAIILGSVPVTINWQADTLEQIEYKISITKATLIIIDSEVPSDILVALRSKFPDVVLWNVETEIFKFESFTDDELMQITDSGIVLADNDTKNVIFTSGTTGHPKGVELTYGNYANNQQAFEQMLLPNCNSPSSSNALHFFSPIMVNPLHHTNSTAIFDWACRVDAAAAKCIKSGVGVATKVKLYLFDKYTTLYWSIVNDIISSSKSEEDVSYSVGGTRFVLPLVSKHIDFLDNLLTAASEECFGALNCSPKSLKWCLSHSILLLGSAPVGPTTIQRILSMAPDLPVFPLTVRYGATETTLQSCGIPLLNMPKDQILRAFQRGWSHNYCSKDGKSASCCGYYIGRQHTGLTQVRVVKSVSKLKPNGTIDSEYLLDCEEGVPGYIIIKGGHVFKSYVQFSESECIKDDLFKTADGWYLRTGDVGFWLSEEETEGNKNSGNRAQELYWYSRESQLLIKGGANYAYEQIIVNWCGFLQAEYGFDSSSFSVAVCGMRNVPGVVESEHDDLCCVMIQILKDVNNNLMIPTEKVTLCKNSVKNMSVMKLPKGSKADFLLIAPDIIDGVEVNEIPMVATKGIVNVPKLREIFMKIYAKT